MACTRRPEVCRWCDSPLIKPRRVAHRFHLVTTLCTLGLWIPAWLAAVVHARALPWRCATCGHCCRGD